MGSSPHSSSDDRSSATRSPAARGRTVNSPKRLELLEVDDALLEQLEHGQEAHDDLELLGDAVGELAETHRAVRGQQREHRVDRVAHAGPDRRDVRGLHFLGGRGRREAAPRPPRATPRARPVRADRAPANGTAPPARPCAPPNGSRSAARSFMTRAASWNVLHSSRRASRRSRSSKRMSSSSRSTSSRPGSIRRALSSTSVAAIRRNSVAMSRSTRSMFSTSTQKTSTMTRERDLPEVDLFFQDEVQQEVERAFENRCRDLVRHGGRIPAPNHRHVVQRGDQPKRPELTARAAGNVTGHGEGLLRHQTDGPDASRQLSGRGAALGRHPARPRIARGPRPPGHLLRRRPARDHDALGPGRAHRVDAAARHPAHGVRPRRGPVTAVRPEPRARPRRADVDPQRRGHGRRAAADDPVQGQEHQG